MKTLSRVRWLAGLLTLASAAGAQAHDHSAEKLGSVHFLNSCAPAVAPQFDRAIALLHSFEFGAAIAGFNDVIAHDSTCAMARWGIALSLWGNPMVANNRSAAGLERGRQAAMAAQRAATHATPRERSYIGAVARLYDNYEHTSQRDRIVAYEKAMSDVATENIADPEATIFYAIALIASAPPSDKTYSNQLRAGSMLESMWVNQPDHPGLAHYIIHAYDVPALAPQAKAAAERYAQIAPTAAHALHMPSHTFTRIGLWHESINTNLRSIDAARRDSNVGEMLHAMDYATYAYLQIGNDSAAKSIVDQLPTLAASYDANAVKGAAPGAAGVFALAAIPARYALERRDWHEAAGLEAHTTTFPHTDAITYFARALGAVHLSDRGRAREAIDSLSVIAERLTAAGEVYWAEQVAIQRLEARAALYFMEDMRNEGLQMMSEAVTREDATEKSAVTPGPLIPAHELMGDIFQDLHRSREALAQYRESLVKEPNRYRSLYGAMHAAMSIGDRKTQADYAAQIEKLTGSRPR